MLGSDGTQKNYNKILVFLFGGGGVHIDCKVGNLVYIKIYKNNKFLIKMIYIHTHVNLCMYVVGFLLTNLSICDSAP